MSGASVLEEPLGRERARVGVQVAAAVDGADRRVDLHAHRHLVAADGERPLAHHPADAGDDRPDAQGLLDHRVEIAVVALARPRAHARVVQHQVEGPGQPGGRRLVPGQQQGEQLVADLAVGERHAVLVAGQQQPGEHVVALLEVGRGAAAGDLGVDDLVDGALARLELPGGAALAAPAHHRVEQQRRRGRATAAPPSPAAAAPARPRRRRARSRTPPAGSPAASATACSPAA